MISETIHEGIAIYVLTTLSHMIAMFTTSAESDAPQAEAFAEFEVPCKVAVGKFVK